MRLCTPVCRRVAASGYGARPRCMAPATTSESCGRHLSWRQWVGVHGPEDSGCGQEAPAAWQRDGGPRGSPCEEALLTGGALFLPSGEPSQRRRGPPAPHPPRPPRRVGARQGRLPSRGAPHRGGAAGGAQGCAPQPRHLRCAHTPGCFARRQICNTPFAKGSSTVQQQLSCFRGPASPRQPAGMPGACQLAGCRCQCSAAGGAAT